jgi:hypothetical protein
MNITQIADVAKYLMHHPDKSLAPVLLQLSIREDVPADVCHNFVRLSPRTVHKLHSIALQLYDALIGDERIELWQSSARNENWRNHKEAMDDSDSSSSLGWFPTRQTLDFLPLQLWIPDDNGMKMKNNPTHKCIFASYNGGSLESAGTTFSILLRV